MKIGPPSVGLIYLPITFSHVDDSELPEGDGHGLDLLISWGFCVCVCGVGEKWWMFKGRKKERKERKKESRRKRSSGEGDFKNEKKKKKKIKDGGKHWSAFLFHCRISVDFNQKSTLSLSFLWVRGCREPIATQDRRKDERHEQYHSC